MVEHPQPRTRPYLDGCPTCLTRNNHPHTVTPDGQPTPGVYAWYECGNCGAAWRTAWDAA